MPELSRFYVIVVQMYVRDHAPPHFHASYGDQTAVVDIRAVALIGGQLPPRARGLVLDWTALHQRELLEAWELAVRAQPLFKIEPLA